MMDKKNATFPALLLSFSLLSVPAIAANAKEGHGHHTGSIGTSPIERDLKSELPTVVFYKLPHCGICTMIDQWLVELDENHPQIANYVRKNSTQKAVQPEMNGRGIEHHGVVFLDTASNTLWSAQAHGLKERELKEAFAEHLVTKTPATPLQDKSSTPAGE